MFAKKLSFYKLWCVFMIGAFCGNLAETIFCRVKFGRWMNRSSFVYGHLSAVWGLAMIFGTFLYYGIRGKESIFLFLTGMVLGGVFEYMCSVFTEKCLGLKFWDYSRFRFNWSGRINLLYCVYWGAVTVFWI